MEGMVCHDSSLLLILVTLRIPLFSLGLDFLLWLSGVGWGWNEGWDGGGRQGVGSGGI